MLKLINLLFLSIIYLYSVSNAFIILTNGYNKNSLSLNKIKIFSSNFLLDDPDEPNEPNKSKQKNNQLTETSQSDQFNNFNKINSSINKLNKKFDGCDQRFPIYNNTNITDKLIKINDEIYQINNNILKNNLLNKLLSKKLKDIEKIKLIIENNYLFNTTTVKYLNSQFISSISPPNLLAGGLDEELEQFKINDNYDEWSS